MFITKSFSKKRLSILFTSVTSLVTLSLIKFAVLHRRYWEGEMFQQSKENLLEKVGNDLIIIIILIYPAMVS